jgi:NAD(P)-dependent dehydrogenase (short-subunit alcohol dehydrogenase family)
VTTYAITGAAQGIGLAVAQEAASRDATTLWAIDRNPNTLSTVADQFPASCTFTPRTVDISARDQVAALQAEWDEVGPPEVLVNVAGVRYLSNFQDLDDRHWDDTLAVNLTGCFNMMRAAARSWIKAGIPGVIANVASTAGEIGVSDRAAYCASKSGVLGLTRAAAIDLSPHGIRVFAVSPGLIRTGMSRPVDDDYVTHRVPLGRRGTVDEVAKAVIDLTKATYITGTSIVVDGGLLAGDRRPLPQP